MGICWDFPLLGTGNESGSNIAAITMFKGAGIMDGLAREVCQNSLDAKNKELGSSVPVKVDFSLINIDKKKYSDVFSGYEEAVENSFAYWENSPLKTQKIMDFLSTVKCALDSEQIPMLVMSDRNTVGLNGVNAGDNEQSFWNLLVNTEGISIKQDNSSAGSFGIGKNAPFAYSALNLVFYNTLALDGGRAFEGVARLVTTQKEYNGEKRKTQPIGKYLFLKDTFSGRPILPEDGSEIANMEIFNRRESDVGTDVAVVGFKKDEYQNWERLTAIAIIKNFILAIKDGKLEASIKSDKSRYEINQDNLKEMLFTTLKDEPELKYTRQIYETLESPDKIVREKIAEENDLTIYVKYNDFYHQSLARFRSTGMLINTTTSDVLPHFSVIVLVNDVGEKKLSSTLREAEPPQHTEWRTKNITDNQTLRNRAGRYIRAINKAVQKTLDEYDSTEISDTMDGGIGNYLPDSSADVVSGEGTDGLKTDLKIKEIKSNAGNVIYSRQYESGESANGTDTGNTGLKTGPKKRKKRKNKKIRVVNPDRGNAPGAARGTGKVRIVSPTITDHRTFYISAKKYKLYVNSPCDYENVYIHYFAGREDDKQDALTVKNVKLEGLPLIQVNAERIGPIHLKPGSNTIYVEFENSEIMALMPLFSMEVSNE